MKLTAITIVTTLALALTSPAQAVNMFAGPLYPTGSDHCECEIVNISAVKKTIQVVILDGAGNQLGSFGPTQLAAGSVLSIASNVAGRQYCKFVGASAQYFHAVLACFHPAPNDSDFVAVPAR